jgi:hypothetical protein
LRADDVLVREVEIAMSNHSKTVTSALSAKDFSCIPLNSHECDLTRYIGELEHVCPSFIAEFLSPRLCTFVGMTARFKTFASRQQTAKIHLNHFFHLVLSVE